ncbi:GlsB/YeaQ/YmgE family stress response membrane protein [Flagellimonas ochracea]
MNQVCTGRLFCTLTNKSDFIGILYALLIGALAGWLAEKIMKGGGFGVLLNIVLGIVGGVVGNWVFGALGVHIGSGVVGNLITGVIGAIVVLFIAGLFKK